MSVLQEFITKLSKEVGFIFLCWVQILILVMKRMQRMPDEGFDEDGGRPADLDANSPVPNKCEDAADGVEQFVCQGCRWFS